jgi:hypothetical protein
MIGEQYYHMKTLEKYIHLYAWTYCFVEP